MRKGNLIFHFVKKYLFYFKEVNRRIQTERMLQDEINRLKRDLENAKQKQPAPTGKTVPTSKTPPVLTDKQPVLDLLKRLSDATHKSKYKLLIASLVQLCLFLFSIKWRRN